MKTAIYPGSFDPITTGHLDVIKRASSVFDEVYIAVLYNHKKKTLFTAEERVDLIDHVVKDAKLDNVYVESSQELAVVYAQQKKAQFLVRGLRATNDFEYELNIFAVNNHIDSKIDTVYLMTKLENSFISSSGVKEMALYNADITGLVHPYVQKAIKAKYQKSGANK